MHDFGGSTFVTEVVLGLYFNTPYTFLGLYFDQTASIVVIENFMAMAFMEAYT